MKETPRARQAWADYLALGSDRSFEKLLNRYRIASEASPTNRLATLKAWSAGFGWQQRLAEMADAEAKATEAREVAARAALQVEGIRSRLNRLTALNDRAERMLRVILERADAEEFKDVAGGTSGLLVRQWKVGRDGQGYEEFAVDTGLLAELRAHEKQAAQELGQWIEKGELAGKDGGPLFKVYAGFDPDRV